MRDNVILANAGLQRFYIQVANIPFCWECYPTYFASDKVYSKEQNAIVDMPLKRCDLDYLGLKSFADGMIEMAIRYPDKQFVVFLPTNSYSAPQSPVIKLTSSPLTIDIAFKVFENASSTAPNNIVFLTDGNKYTSSKQYYDHYFRTDHHWNGIGAIEAFNDMSTDLGKEPYHDYNIITSVNRYLGSHSRIALQLTDEPILDPDIDYSAVIISQDENESDGLDGNDHSSFSTASINKYFDFHGAYYTSGSKYTGPADGTALLVSDSFGDAIARPIANRYSTLYRNNLLHGHSTQGSMINLIESYNPDSIITIATLSDYESATDHISGLFE